MTDMSHPPAKPARSRRARRPRRSGAVPQMPWRRLENPNPPHAPLSPEAIEALHATTLRILSEIGIQFLNPEAVGILKEAGCRVEGENVRFDPEFVTEMVARAPGSFDIIPRNPDHRLGFGGNRMAFGAVASAPNVWDRTGGKRSGDRAAFQDLTRLTQHFNCLHFQSGYPVEPLDLHASTRHLDCLFDMLTLSDKVCHAYSLGAERIEDGMEMARIAAGLSHEAFEAAPRMFTNINSVSPLKHDFPMIDGALRCARRGQPVVVTPFTLAGAMAPVTLSGAVALSLAEALSAIALLQYLRPGAPVILGTFTSNVDMKSGAPAFGTPEYMRATEMTGQMARFYGLPLRSSGVCAANIPDGQAMWETSNSLWSAVHSGTNMVFHAAGWLEGGLIASPAKMVMDCEILQFIQRYFEPETWSATPDDLAFDAIREVGADGHYFGCEHTQARYETAFHQPFMSDWRNYEAWEAAGGLWTSERAHDAVQTLLAEFTPPPMDPAHREELERFVAIRKEEGGAPTDF